jgi:exosortase D (VPLPA-CTERM-specific)
MSATVETNLSDELERRRYWRINRLDGGRLALLLGLLILLFWPTLTYLFEVWTTTEEYSHGLMLPAISAFLIWRKHKELAEVEFTGSNWGIAVLVGGIGLFLIGELSSLVTVQQYAFLIALFGAVLACLGWRAFKIIWIPLFFMFFAIPLPVFFYKGLSATLQLWSSALGVAFIRVCNISVFLEGNVIDLGSMQLQVAEACNGLRYLFPLTSVAFICAYFYQAAFWKRAVVFLSSIPITLLMNSFRIGVIGVLVEYWGKSMAEGFLHDFEGWIVFMGCTAILVGEMWLLKLIGGDSRPLSEVFGISFPEAWTPGTRFRDRTLPKQYWVTGAILLMGFLVSLPVERRTEIIPERAAYLEFPMQLGEWRGQRQALEQKYLDVLKLDDYVMADYVRQGDRFPVNFYSAYYATQRKGESIHSPRTCMPGGGWEIQSLETIIPKGFEQSGGQFKINRAIIQKGPDRQLVYYWFRQRGRNITNEYLAKWYLLWDAITMNRSDGALVRLTTFVPENQDMDGAEQRLVDFLHGIEPQLERFIAD